LPWRCSKKRKHLLLRHWRVINNNNKYKTHLKDSSYCDKNISRSTTASRFLTNKVFGSTLAGSSPLIAMKTFPATSYPHNLLPKAHFNTILPSIQSTKFRIIRSVRSNFEMKTDANSISTEAAEVLSDISSNRWTATRKDATNEFRLVIQQAEFRSTEINVVYKSAKKIVS
jgi:hypothetical protein